MQIFLDTAKISEIEKGLEWGMVDGATTNPTLIAKEGKKYLDTVKEIARLVPGPVSGEVLATDFERSSKKGAFSPSSPTTWWSRSHSRPPACARCARCAKEDITTNVTLCFSPAQALVAAKAGAGFISPFVGRLDDVGESGMALIAQICEIYDNYDFDTQVLVASVRHPMHVVEAARLGADAATIPFKILEQLYQHPLTDLGLARFLADWKTRARTFDGAGSSAASAHLLRSAGRLCRLAWVSISCWRSPGSCGSVPSRPGPSASRRCGRWSIDLSGGARWRAALLVLWWWSLSLASAHA